MLAAEHFLVYAEPILSLVALIAFFKAGLARRLPATRNYLFLRIGSTGLLYSILEMHHVIPIAGATQYHIYFYAYWSLYLAGAVMIFFVIREIYSELMRPVPHLRKLGMMAFRWAIAISCIFAGIVLFSASFAPAHGFDGQLVYLAQLCYRSVSVLELCLLAFVALTIHSMGRSFRSPLFGIALGLGIEAASEFFSASVVVWQHEKVWSAANLVTEAVIVAVLLTWTAYFLLPKPKESAVVMVVPEPSPLIRWNDVAQALGHSSPRVAAGNSSGFFLQDVEKVVDRVLARNGVSLDAKSSDSKAG
ncbi:MAG: hypothetical protein ACP5M4_06925 [Acidobacteriaceae bacterium]